MKIIASMIDRYFPPNFTVRDLTCTELNLYFGCLQASISVAVHVLNHGTALAGATLVSNRNKFIPWTSWSSVCFLKGLQNFYQVTVADTKKNLCRKKGLW